MQMNPIPTRVLSSVTRPQALVAAFTLLVTLLLPGPLGSAEPRPFWPEFRGPNGCGISETARPPVQIGPAQGVLWMTEVPWGPSSPSIWENHLYLTSYTDGQLQTHCYDRETGNLVWTKGVTPEAVEVFHRTDGSPAASTPAVDGQHVVSYFGSFGLICHDPAGKELWRRPMPVARSLGSFGSGTSPIILGDKVILNRDLRDGSVLLALDLKTGRVLWESPRPTAFGSFGTPIHWRNAGVDEIVVPGSLQLKGYDLQTGAERWRVNPVSPLSCTTPVTGQGRLYFAAWSPGAQDNPWPEWKEFASDKDRNQDGVIDLAELPDQSRDFFRGLDLNDDARITEEDWKQLRATSSKGENVLLAIEPGGQGDLSESHVAWKFKKNLPYVPSPLFYQGRIYLMRDLGLISSLDAKTGNPFYVEERLPARGSYYASPVAADGRIYVASLAGQLLVVKAGGDTPEVLHQADFKDRIFATPALVGDRLYLRTEHKLYAFGPARTP